MSVTLMKPVLTARFDLDAQGRPVFTQSNGVRHYKINYRVNQPPDGTFAVRYTLDSTYNDPVRETTNAESGFKLHTTSYGDYPVKVDIRRRGGNIEVVEILSRLLARSHESEMSPEIQAAIEDIRTH